MRLAKYLAHAGVASRRAAEEIVRAGRVTVGGEVVRDPARDVDERSVVAVDGRELGGAETRAVYALNKPFGVLSTAEDPYGRPTVVSLLAGAAGAPGGAAGVAGASGVAGSSAARPSGVPRLYPVGRLDADSTGLILLTNDGELAHRLTHPSFHVPKTYRVRVAGGKVGESALRALREGVRLEDGPTAPAQVRRVPSKLRSLETIELTIHEGRNRQVRRMCEAVGHPVESLERIAFGPLKLGDLAPGATRRLTGAEVERLRRAGA
jgi:23S rRNA pseudouridine2605 synthase